MFTLHVEVLLCLFFIFAFSFCLSVCLSVSLFVCLFQSQVFKPVIRQNKSGTFAFFKGIIRNGDLSEGCLVFISV